LNPRSPYNSARRPVRNGGVSSPTILTVGSNCPSKKQSHFQPRVCHGTTWLFSGGFSRRFSPPLQAPPRGTLRTFVAATTDRPGLGAPLFAPHVVAAAPLTPSAFPLPINDGQFLSSPLQLVSHITRAKFNNNSFLSGPRPCIFMQMGVRKRAFDLDRHFISDYQLQLARCKSRDPNLLASSGKEIFFRYPFVRFITCSPHTDTPPTMPRTRASFPPPAVFDSGANQFCRDLTFTIAERHLKPRQLELDFLPLEFPQMSGRTSTDITTTRRLSKRSALYWECQRKFGNVCRDLTKAAFGYAAVSSTWERHLESDTLEYLRN
jgi:hypothetical protein